MCDEHKDLSVVDIHVLMTQIICATDLPNGVVGVPAMQRAVRFTNKAKSGEMNCLSDDAYNKALAVVEADMDMHRARCKSMQFYARLVRGAADSALSDMSMQDAFTYAMAQIPELSDEKKTDLLTSVLELQGKVDKYFGKTDNK